MRGHAPLSSHVPDAAQRPFGGALLSLGPSLRRYCVASGSRAAQQREERCSASGTRDLACNDEEIDCPYRLCAGACLGGSGAGGGGGGALLLLAPNRTRVGLRSKL